MTGATAKPRGSWIPWIFVAGFGVVFAVNMLMVYVGIVTWPGLLTERSWDLGLNYDRAIAARQRQDALGWRPELVVRQEGDGLSLRLILRDADDLPLPGGVVSGVAVRPLEEGRDQRFTLTERVPGRYDGMLPLPLRGVWDLEILIERGADRHVVTRRVQWLP